jgi:response regulator of citrate/malate metabolism
MRQSKLTAEQIEEAAWAAALRAPAVTDVIPPGWFTTKQLADKLGKTRPTMARLLSEAVAAGRCEVQRFRITTGAVTRPVPHYKTR